MGEVTNPRRVGVVGVGNMGGAMVRRLLELGWEVGVRDIDADREGDAVRHGAQAFATPATLAAAHPVVVVVVVDAPRSSSSSSAATARRSRCTPERASSCARRSHQPAAKPSRRDWRSAASTASTRRCRAARHGRATAA
jgi:UDP-N-acetylmuramoylalanine-D-glutamate ligase